MPIENLSFAGSALQPNLLSTVRAAPELSDSPQPPSNSEIRRIVEDVAGALTYSLTAVAANLDQTVRSDSIENDFKQFLRSLPQERLQTVVRNAKGLAEAPAEVRVAMFGRAGIRSAVEHIGAAGGFARFDDGLSPLKIDEKLLGVRPASVTVPIATLRDTPDGLLLPRAEMPANSLDLMRGDFEDAREAAANSGVMDASRLAAIYGEIHDQDLFAGEGAAPGDFEELAVTDKIGLWVSEIMCVDETNPEFWGSDEIALAGVSVDEDGDTKKIGEKFIGGGFDDGDKKSYGDRWRYEYFSLREGANWPKRYSVSFALAEKDHGGLSKFLDKIWAAVRDKVKAAIAKAVATGLTPYLGELIARWVGEAVAWVIDVLVGWIIKWFGDDIFPVKTISVTTPSMAARWNYPNGTWGNPSSGVRYIHFYGHGGHYRLAYYWKFFA